MTQQTQNDPGTMLPSLETKLRQITDHLTSEEQAQLRAMETHDVSGMMSWPLRDKAQQVVDVLTPEEQAQLRLWVKRAGASAENGEEADTQGHMISQDRVQPGPEGTGGGGGFPNRFAHNVKVLFGPLVDALPLVPR